MKSAEKIFKDAQISPKVYKGYKAMDNGTYNTGYMLSHEQIQAAALLKISEKQNISLKEAAKQHYIDGISVAGADFSADKSLIDAYFGETIDNAVKSAQSSGKPAFFSVDADNHFVMVALVPNSDTGKLSVLYLNSITESTLNHDAAKKEFIDALKGKEFGLNEKDILSLKGEFIDKIDNISEQEFQDLQVKFVKRAKQLNPNLIEVELLQAQFINLQENIIHTQKLSEVGKDFADALVDNLKSKGIQLENDKIIDKSQDQQLANCCGLSVASNIADVSSHVASKKSLDKVKDSLFTPKTTQEKEPYYKDFGKKLFAILDIKNLTEKSEYLLPPSTQLKATGETAHILTSGGSNILLDLKYNKVTREITIATENFVEKYKNHALLSKSHLESFIKEIVNINEKHGLITPEQRKLYYKAEIGKKSKFTQDVEKTLELNVSNSDLGLKDGLYNIIGNITKSLGLTSISRYFKEQISESGKRELSQRETKVCPAKEMAKSLNKSVQKYTVDIVQGKGLVIDKVNKNKSKSHKSPVAFVVR